MTSRISVVVNARSLVPDEIGGLEYATRDTLSALREHCSDRIELTIWTSAAGRSALRQELPGVPCEDCPPGSDARALTRRLRAFDVLWCPLFFLRPAPAPIATVVTVPDMLHESWPGHLTRRQLAERVREVRASVGWATRILVPSGATRDDVLRAFPEAEARIRVVPHPVGVEFVSPPDPATQLVLRVRHRLPESFVVALARPWPHKDHETLLVALAVLEAPPVVVLPDATGPHARGLRRRVAELGLSGVVRFLPRLARHDLPHLLDLAAALVCPSRHEGFALPVLEAMQRGTPVITSRIPAHEELAGTYATLVRPGSPDELAEALSRIDSTRRERANDERRAVAEATADLLSEAATAGARPAATPRRALRVFVVTPSLNQGRYLAATIDSVLGQDYPHLDYHVADGGSDDESLDILRAHGDRVAWTSRRDGGQAAAIADAWSQSDADVVAWLNSDDTYRPGAVTAAVEFLEHHPEHAMVYGHGRYVDARGNEGSLYPTRAQFERSALAGNCFVCQPTVFLRREVFRVVDLPRRDLECAFDYDLWIRIAAHFTAGFLDREIATVRLHDAAKSVVRRDLVYAEIAAVTRTHFGVVDMEWVTGFLHHRLRRGAAALLAAAPPPLRRVAFQHLMRRMEAR